MEQEKRFNNKDGIFSKKVRAGKRRTYFFDVRATRSNDYYLTITESKKRFQDDTYERHKLHLYKEDFNKFLGALQETVDHIKSELMPEYDFDEYTRRDNKRHINQKKTEEKPIQTDNNDPKIVKDDDLTWE